MFERLTLLARSNPLRLLCLMWFGLVWALSPVQAQQPEVVNWDALTISASDAETTQSLIPRLQDRYDPDLLKEFDLSVWEDLPLAEPLLGRDVAIDGYVLPLVSEGARVTEFLLVPWIGACIHAPTPAPNQMVHVSYPDGLRLDKPYDPMRIRGVLQSQPDYHPLFLVDGSRAVPAAYVLENAAVFGTPGVISAASAADVPLLARAQIWVNDLFLTAMSGLSGDGLSNALLFALLVSFGYGALHTFGPGHGKSVVVSYFVGTGGSLGRGVTMGIRIAVIHVLSAVIVVWLLDFAVRQATGSAPSDYRAIRLGSYALICAIGSVMLFQAVQALLSYRWASDHDPDHHHDHHHSGCAACEAAASTKGGGWIALSVGIVPCTGALLVMLFGLANDLIWPAILMVAFISLGMACAMSALGVAALWGRRWAENRMGRDETRVIRFELGARVAGALCVLAIGVTLFVVTWTVPQALQWPQAGVVATHHDALDTSS